MFQLSMPVCQCEESLSCHREKNPTKQKLSSTRYHVCYSFGRKIGTLLGSDAWK
uniref:Uncharacterized protein n=1 Tax=Aegilops tauschii subsp. strangulata TaxID=200361 RepID=A0A453JSK3_AEGTS